VTSYLEDVQIQSITADAAKGGWECTLVCFQDTDCIEKWQEVRLPFRFGSSDGWDEDDRDGLVGHALPLGIDYDFLTANARFSIATSHRFLEGMSVQGIGFTEAAAPANSHQITNMRLGHIVEHILEDHCNISTTTNPEGWVDTSDIDVTNSTRVDRYNFHQTNNAWSALQALARNEFYWIYFSKDNAVHYVGHPMFGTLPTPVMEFTSAFCSGRPTVNIRAVKNVSQVILKATTDDGAVLTSTYPATPANEGQPKEMTRIRCNVQARLDTLARREYDWESRTYTVEWPAPGFSGLLFELLDRVSVTYTGTAANGVHIDWTDKKFWIHRMQMAPGEGFTGQTIFTLEEEPTISAP
jgi:hypothetical protein